MMKQEHVKLIDDLLGEIRFSFDEAIIDKATGLLEKEGLDPEENEDECMYRYHQALVHFGKPLAIRMIKELADLYELRVTIGQ